MPEKVRLSVSGTGRMPPDQLDAVLQLSSPPRPVQTRSAPNAEVVANPRTKKLIEAVQNRLRCVFDFMVIWGIDWINVSRNAESK